MFATIKQFGETSFTVKAPGRSISGFTSLQSAAAYIETLGWVLWDDPDAEE